MQNDKYPAYEELSPEYISQWRAGIVAAYAVELKTRAELAGLMQSPVMLAKIAQAEADAEAARREAQVFG